MKNNSLNILITSGANSLEIVNHLKYSFKYYCKIIVMDIKYSELLDRNADKYIISPKIDDEDYSHFLLSLLKKEQIDIIIPTTNSDTYFFSKYNDLIKSEGAIPIVSSLASVELCIDKIKLYEYSQTNNISIPKFFEVKNIVEFKNRLFELGFPKNTVAMKPSKYPDGSGKGFRIIDDSTFTYKQMFFGLPSQMYYVTSNQVISAMEGYPEFPPQLLMEYLPGQEYSVYCFCDKGEAKYIVPNKKLSIYETNTKDAIIENNSEIIDIAYKICKLIGFDYNVNIQLKYSIDGIPKLIEINPRVAGTIMLPVKGGVDLLEYSIEKALNIKYNENSRILFGTKLFRRIKSYYLEFKNSNELTYCFDIDGTICSANCDYADSTPNIRVINKINKLYETGNYIIIFTSRGYKSGKDWHKFSENQLIEWGVKFHELKTGKPQYSLLVDDHAMNITDWMEI